ncbi:MAG: hypothetical protein ACO2O4_00300 [Minisyncoccia bacterium]|jgi:hypothetical protein
MAFFNIDKKVSWKKAILISVGVFVLSIILMLSPSDKTSRLTIFGASLFILSFFMPFLIRFYPILGKIKEKGYKWKAYSYILMLIFASIILLLGIIGPNLETTENTKERILSQENRNVIKGKTDPNTKIKIQNNEVEVGKDGIFTYTLELLEGKNIINIIADNGQKQKKITLIITRRGNEAVRLNQNISFPRYIEIFPPGFGKANKAFYVEEHPSPEIFPVFLEFLAKNHCPPKNKYPVCVINVFKHPNPYEVCLNPNIPWEECEKIIIGHWDNLHSPPKRWFKDPSGKQIDF